MALGDEVKVAMKEGRGSYMPPTYIPLGGLEQSDSEAEKDEVEVAMVPSQMMKAKSEGSGMPHQWTSGICACCDDPQSCKITSASVSVSSWFFRNNSSKNEKVKRDKNNKMTGRCIFEGWYLVGCYIY